MVATEPRRMGRKKLVNPVPFSNCKIESSFVDKARSMLFWVRRQLPEEKRIGYSLQHYLTDCVAERRSLSKDYAAYSAFIREESKRLDK